MVKKKSKKTNHLPVLPVLIDGPEDKEAEKNRFDKFLEKWQGLSGKENAEDKALLDYLFQALGYEDAMASGGKFEVDSTINVLKSDPKTGVIKNSKKKIGRMDFLWRGRVLVEVKSRKEKLPKHRNQLFNYWDRIILERPRYSILTNFDEFWIYDFDEQPDEPVLDILPQLKQGDSYCG